MFIIEACVTNLTITCVLQDDVSVQHGGPRLPPHVSEDAQPDGRMEARGERVRARLRLPDTPPCNVRLLCCVNVLGGPTWCSRKLYGKPIYCSKHVYVYWYVEKFKIMLLTSKLSTEAFTF